MATKEKAAGVLVQPATAYKRSCPQIIGADLSADKPFRTLQAQFALLGHELVQFPDGSYACCKWGLTKLLRDIQAVQAFYRQIGGEA